MRFAYRIRGLLRAGSLLLSKASGVAPPEGPLWVWIGMTRNGAAKPLPAIAASSTQHPIHRCPCNPQPPGNL